MLTRISQVHGLKYGVAILLEHEIGHWKWSVQVKWRRYGGRHDAPVHFKTVADAEEYMTDLLVMGC